MDAAWGRADVIRLEVGEPDFPPAQHIVDAAYTAALNGAGGYTPSAGIPQLREALATKVGERNGYKIAPEQVVLAQGGIEAIFASLLTVTQPGDEILLPDPAWPNFQMIAALLNLVAITYPVTEDTGFLPDIDELERLVSDRTTTILVNSPSNPVGAVIGRGAMTELLSFTERHGLWMLSDECYDEIIFGDQFVSPASLSPGRVISIYSFSKTYAMTGWRVGYAVAPREVAATLANCQTAVVSCINAPAQYAALAAVTGPQQVVADMRDTYRRRRDLSLAMLDGSPLHATTPQGAFYLWVDVRSIGLPSRELALRLLELHGVAVAPGTAFGERGEGFVRVSLAASESSLVKGLERLIHMAER